MAAKKTSLGTRVTMSDVAKIAGVSHQTVSRVLNEPGRVSAETQTRVRSAIEQLNYQRSAVARALATRRTQTIGLISTGLAVHHHSKRMVAFNESARAAGYQVSMASLATGERDQLTSAFDVLLGQGVEGVVLIAADERALRNVRDIDLGVPLVTAESSGRSGPHNVAIDQFLGAARATGHLADLGHRQVAHLAGPAWSLDANERLKGWRAELERRSLPVPDPEYGDWTPDSGYEIGRRLVEAHEASAVFVANDQMALGLLHALADCRVRVPTQMSVVGFDDVPEAAHFIPPLTTVRQDFDELGRQLMTTLLALIEGTEPGEPVHTEPELVVRKSTAPPRRPASG
jgi:DNA-binding LacI/PurR family transcriptional regulator